MSNEYIALPVDEENVTGLLTISKSAVETIAATAVLEVENVKLAEKTNFRSPVVCKIVNEVMRLTVDIRIDYNAKIGDVCLAVQKKINQVLNQTIALSCEEIDVRVVGFIF